MPKRAIGHPITVVRWDRPTGARTGMNNTGYKVCEYRNVAAAYRRFLEPRLAETTLQPFIRLLDIADNARLVLRASRRAQKTSASAA